MIGRSRYELPPVIYLVVSMIWFTYPANKLYVKMIRYLQEIYWNLHTSIFYLKLKVNNRFDMASCAFWACFCFCWRPSEIGPTAENKAVDNTYKWVILPCLWSFGPTQNQIFSAGPGFSNCCAPHKSELYGQIQSRQSPWSSTQLITSMTHKTHITSPSLVLV